MTDAHRRAFALLGLPPGASPDEVRRQYKALVRRWHPDRFAGDPQGQAEAAVRMRAINDAYRLLIGRDTNGRGRPAADPPPSPDPRPPGTALSREEIDAMVRALGTEGPIDLFLVSLQEVGRRFLKPLGIVFVTALSFHLLFTLLRGDWRMLWSDPRPLVYAIVVAIGLVAPSLYSKTEGGKR
jgi:hypothetical protein